MVPFDHEARHYHTGMLTKRSNFRRSRPVCRSLSRTSSSTRLASTKDSGVWSMQSVWHSACLRTLERYLARKDVFYTSRRCFSSTPSCRAPKRTLAMEDYTCDVIRWVGALDGEFLLNYSQEISLSLPTLVNSPSLAVGLSKTNIFQ